MAKYIAFLRAINVGGHIVKMEQLRRLFEEMEFANVETFIASGNVIFDSRSSASASEKKIEKFLKQKLGYEVATFIRTLPELAAIDQYKPFSETELYTAGHTLYVGFLANILPKAAVKNVSSLAGVVDDLHVFNREVYWLCRTSFGDSEVSGAVLAKALGTPTTFRNINTVRRLVAKYGKSKEKGG
jgi:uncharacterized protein (DUF1697 family)